MNEPMIDLVKLNSRLPVGDRNGLDSLGAQVANHPTGKFALIMLCDVVELTTKVDTHQRIGKLRILQVEALSRKDFAAGEQLLRRAHESRTGQQTLPEHIEVDVTQAFHPHDDEDEDPDDGGDLE